MVTTQTAGCPVLRMRFMKCYENSFSSIVVVDTKASDKTRFSISKGMLDNTKSDKT
jgi:hypothetical protein